MRRERYISKSKFLHGLQCPKLLWCDYNAKHLFPAADDALQAVFDQGHDVGALAKKMFPNGIEIDADPTDSCHPTFLSSLFISPLSPLHYLTHKTDKVADLEREHHKWVSFFCDPKTDPKDVIRQACGFEDVKAAKAAINQSLNSSAEHPEYLKWMKTEFPLIFQLWQETEVKYTGNAISKTFERQLMLHEELYDRAEDLGIVKIMPEHDGLGVFAEDDDTKLPSKLASLAKYLQTYSIKHFGVPIVIKTKMVVDWTGVDLLMEMEHKLEQLGKDYSKVKPKVNRLQRKYFSEHRDAKTGQELGEALEKEHHLLRRNKGVLEYWLERRKRGL